MLEMFKKKSNEVGAAGDSKKSGSLNGRKLRGVVVSDKMKKTVVVAVSNLKLHSKYKKYFNVTKRFKAHDENNEFRVGDKVIIQETRPLSREKRWVVISKL